MIDRMEEIPTFKKATGPKAKAENLAEKLGITPGELNRKRRIFKKRLGKMPRHLQPYVLNMYANPVIRKAEIVTT